MRPLALLRVDDLPAGEQQGIGTCTSGMQPLQRGAHFASGRPRPFMAIRGGIKARAQHGGGKAFESRQRRRAIRGRLCHAGRIG